MRDQDLFLQRALLEDGLVSADQLENAQRYGVQAGIDLADALVQTDTLTSRQINLTKADICEVGYVELRDYEPYYTNSALLARNIADRYCCFPLFLIDGVLTVAMGDPLNLEATDQIRYITKYDVDPVVADRDQIRSLIAKAYSLSQAHHDQTGTNVNLETDIEVGESSRPVVAAVNQMLADAMQQRASDVHINPDEHDMRLRYRVDGVLHERQGPALSMHTSIVQRLKVMAQLDLTNTRTPQDGKFRFRYRGVNVDVRVSVVPTVWGENVVLRLLVNNQAFEDFQDLGMPGSIVEALEKVISYPHGMVLVTGPTGSGKTTTLYTTLSKLNDPSRNIITIEDPVEIRLPYVRQIQTAREIGLTFANALRSILRQDPDVVLVGEIRDAETASIALQAAMTGHLVFSTLHTNDAIGAIPRLQDFDLPTFLINSAVVGVLAQRLVRRVCPDCQVEAPVDALWRRRFGVRPDEVFVHGKGCSRCGQTGYRGRVGLYEFFRFTPELRHVVETGGSIDQLRHHAVQGGMRLMWQEGLDKARLGQTTLEEVYKVASMQDVDASQCQETVQ